MYMERFSIKISGNKKLSKEDIFPDAEVSFHPSVEDISEFLDGISLTELVSNFNLLRDVELTFVDGENDGEWVYVGFGWGRV